MKLLRNPGELEFYIVAALLLLYVLYLVRLGRISKVLPLVYTTTIAKVVLRFLYFSLFVFVLLGPSIDKPKTNEDAKVISKDIFVALDLSNSMNANDVVPNPLSSSSSLERKR